MRRILSPLARQQVPPAHTELNSQAGRSVVRRRLRVAFNVKCLALGSAALPWTGACLAGNPGNTPGMQGREISFYISQPIGPGAATRSFGFRIDQHSNPGSLP